MAPFPRWRGSHGSLRGGSAQKASPREQLRFNVFRWAMASFSQLGGCEHYGIFGLFLKATQSQWLLSHSPPPPRSTSFWLINTVLFGERAPRFFSGGGHGPLFRSVSCVEERGAGRPLSLPKWGSRLFFGNWTPKVAVSCWCPGKRKKEEKQHKEGLSSRQTSRPNLDYCNGS